MLLTYQLQISLWERNKHDSDNIMLWVACCTCFFGFLRSGEITVPSLKCYDQSCHLSEGDVLLMTPQLPTAVQVTIKASKTDPFRKGVKVYLGKTESPVAAVSEGKISRPIFPLQKWPQRALSGEC